MTANDFFMVVTPPEFCVVMRKKRLVTGECRIHPFSKMKYLNRIHLTIGGTTKMIGEKTSILIFYRADVQIFAVDGLVLKGRSNGPMVSLKDSVGYPCLKIPKIDSINIGKKVNCRYILNRQLNMQAVMPDLIRHPVRTMDSRLRGNDTCWYIQLPV